MSVGPGETDLATMLSSLAVERRPGTFTFVTEADPSRSVRSMAHAIVKEEESTTLVLAVDDAVRAGYDATLEMAWLTLAVHSSLEAVGLTAAFSGLLGEANIPCNVLAGFHHDHILVPVSQADEAISVLTVR